MAPIEIDDFPSDRNLHLWLGYGFSMVFSKWTAPGLGPWHCGQLRNPPAAGPISFRSVLERGKNPWRATWECHPSRNAWGMWNLPKKLGNIELVGGRLKTILENMSQWGWDDIPYMKWKIINVTKPPTRWYKWYKWWESKSSQIIRVLVGFHKIWFLLMGEI